MPKRSRIQRFGLWLSTVARSIGALFVPTNIKNAFVCVTKNWRSYICFYLAALAMGAGFWTVTLCGESNLRESRARVEENFHHHIEVVVPSRYAYVDMDKALAYEWERDGGYLASYEWENGGRPLADGSYVARLTLKASPDLETSLIYLRARTIERHTYTDIHETPLFDYETDFEGPYTTQLYLSSLVWFLFSWLVLFLLFLVRMDHFRFTYGVYMTCGADFPRLMGVAGGESCVIAALMFLPSGLVGFGLAACLYVPSGMGIGLSARAVLLSLGGLLLSSFCAAWFPMRRLSVQMPTSHLTGADHTAHVSSPRRSFYLFGGTFPGKYELYGMWRMRTYYIRLVLSAVLFAAVFVTGLYAAEMVNTHNQTEARAYTLSFKAPSAEDPEEPTPTETESEPSDDPETEVASSDPAYETEVESLPAWWAGAAEADELWGDAEIFLSDVQAIPGVSHVTWSAALGAGYTSSHLLVTPSQVQSAGKNVVASGERADSGHKWATNEYDYTAIDKLWIDNMVNDQLCTFEGDPYAILSGGNSVIVSEDIFNQKTYNFHPGDTIIVAVCEKVLFTDLVLDPQEILRGQIRENVFRYEEYTVAAVMRGNASDDHILFGVTVDNYRALTNQNPRRDEMAVYMHKGTDMDTVRAAEAALRAALTYTPGWSVKATDNYFDAEVRSLKNDDAVILALSAGLLLISPLIWYFSQILFYKKRRREFAVLRAIGATDRALSRIYRMAGGILSGCACLATILLSMLLNYGIYWVVGTLIPKYFGTTGVHYTYSLSLPALLACVAISVACGFFSCEVPYRLWSRRDPARDAEEL